MDRDPLLDVIGIKILTVFAALAGSLLQLFFAPKLSKIGAVVSVFGGFVIAIVCAPIARTYISEVLEGGVIFLVGLLGMQIIGKIYLFTSNLTPKDFVALLMRIFNVEIKNDDNPRTKNKIKD